LIKSSLFFNVRTFIKQQGGSAMKKGRYVVVCCSLVFVAHGGVVGRWDVEGVKVSDGTGIATSEAPFTMVGGSDYDHLVAELRLGAGVNPSTTLAKYGFKVPTDTQSGTLAEAIERNQYLEVSLEVSEGYVLNLDRLEMVGEGTSDGCSNVVWMSSVDGFTAGAELASSFPANQDGALDTDADGFGGPIDLSGARYQQLQGSVRLRLYGWNSSSERGVTRIRNLSGDDLVVYGEVVPKGYVAPDLLAGWDVVGIDLNDGLGIETAAPPYTCAAITSAFTHVTAFLRLGGGVNPSTSPDQYGFKVATSNQAATLSEAISAGHYIECVLIPDEGYMLNMDRLELNGQSTASGCSNMVLMSSVAGFSDGQQLASALDMAGKTGGFDTAGSGFGGPIQFGAEHRGITGELAFRLYGWGSSSGSGVSYIRNLSGLDFKVIGSVVATEAAQLPRPTCSLVTSNGLSQLHVVFARPATAGYVVQRRADLSDTNGWTTVSGVFSNDYIWSVDMSQPAAFFRSVSE
jgi:hypothetical protein